MLMPFHGRVALFPLLTKTVIKRPTLAGFSTFLDKERGKKQHSSGKSVNDGRASEAANSCIVSIAGNAMPSR